MGSNLGKVRFRRVFVSKADSLCHPVPEVGGEALGVRGEMHKKFLLWIFFLQIESSRGLVSSRDTGVFLDLLANERFPGIPRVLE